MFDLKSRTSTLSSESAMIVSVFSSPFSFKIHARKITDKRSRAFLAEKDTRVTHQGLSLYSILAPRTDDVDMTVYPWGMPRF